MYAKTLAKHLEFGQVLCYNGIMARIVFKEDDLKRDGYIRVIVLLEPIHSWNGFSISFRDDDIVEYFR